MNYAEILKKAWNTIWKHKILWLFGLLAGSAIGGGQGLSYRFSSHDRFGHYWENGQEFPPMFERMSAFFRGVPAYAWALIAGLAVIVGLLISLSAFFLREYGVAGVIKGSALADDPQTGKLKLSAVHQALKPHYWRLILLRLLVICASALLAGLLAIPIVIFIIGTLGVGLCCLLPLFVLLIPIGWGARVLVHNASIALVDENLDVLLAISRAWEVTTQNLGPLLVLHLILGAIRFVAALLMSIPMIAAALPLIFALQASSAGWPMAAGLVSGLLWLLLLPIALAVFGALNTFDLSARALAFRELKHKVHTLPLGTQALPQEETK